MSDGIRCLHPAAPEHYSVTLNDFGEGGNICNMVLQKLKDLSPLRNTGKSDTSCKEQQISVFSPVKLILFVDAQVLVIMHTSTLMLTGLKWVLCFQKSTTKIPSLCNVKFQVVSPTPLYKTVCHILLLSPQSSDTAHDGEVSSAADRTVSNI